MQVLGPDGAARPAKVAMTVQHLLTHTAGLTYDFMGGEVAKRYADAGITFSGADPAGPALRGNPVADVPAAAGTLPPGSLLTMVKKLAALPLKCEPGTAFNYSVSIDVIGCIIEQVTGQPLGEFLQTEILGPLGMSETAFHVPAGGKGRFSACYELTDDGFRLQDDPATSSFHTPQPHFASGGGGLISTPADYTKFMLMMLGKGELAGTRILSRKTVEFMMLNHLEPGVTVPPGFLHAYKGVGFGIGGSVTIDPARNAVIGSCGQWGWGGAANTFMTVDPAEGLGFLLFTQVTPSFKLCFWRRDLTAMIQSCIVDERGVGGAAGAAATTPQAPGSDIQRSCEHAASLCRTHRRAAFPIHNRYLFAGRRSPRPAHSRTRPARRPRRQRCSAPPGFMPAPPPLPASRRRCTRRPVSQWAPGKPSSLRQWRASCRLPARTGCSRPRHATCTRRRSSARR